MSDDDSPKLPPRIVDSRKSVRKRVLFGAKVIYGERGFSMDCRIRDVSETGARIILPAGQIIPTRVILLDARSRVAYEAEVVWIAAPEFGLKFTTKHSLAEELPPSLEFLKRYC